jgi:hypothetical protein
MISFPYTGLSYVLLGTVFLAMLSIVFVSWRNGISPMPSSEKVRLTVADEINRLRKFAGPIVDFAGFFTMDFRCEWYIS